MNDLEKIGLGGGCHWCTEAVFQSLKGVVSVAQGYISATHNNSSFSEGVCVTFNPERVNLRLLIEVHLHTHKSTKNHSMRDKYRSAIYTFSKIQKHKAQSILSDINSKNTNEIITKVLNFKKFKFSKEESTNYYFSNTEKPFCQTYIGPKLKLLLETYNDDMDLEKLKHLKFV